MSDNSKATQREQALIGVLERLAGEMERHEVMLADICDRQKQFAKSLESIKLQQKGRHPATEKSGDTPFDAVSRYRSDMLSLVNEQDIINKNIESLQASLKASTFTLDATSETLKHLDKRMTLHEKASNDYYGYAAKQPDILAQSLISLNRDFTKLHIETEKNIVELNNRIARQIDKHQSDTIRRFLLLDDIAASLQTILIRTEPPEKKPLLVVRLFKKLQNFVRNKTRLLFKRKE